MSSGGHRPVSDGNENDRLRQQIALLRQGTEELRSTLAHSGIQRTGPESTSSDLAPLAASWTWDLLRHRMSWSERFYEMHGLTRDADPSYEQFLETVHREDRGRLREHLAAALRQEHPYDTRFRIVRSDGVRWIAAAGDVIRDEQGRPAALIAVHSDVTAEVLRAGDNRFDLNSIIEDSEDAIIGETPQGIITSWNQGAERIFGYARVEVVGKPISMLTWPGREDEIPAMLARIREGQRVEHFETIRRSKHDRAVRVSITLSPVRDSAGKIIGACSIARDITRTKRAEADLRDAEARYRDLFENSPLLVSIIDPETGRFVEVNRMFSLRLGYHRTETGALRLDDVIPNYTRSMLGALAARDAGAHHAQFVTPYRAKSGELLEMLVTARPIRRDDRILVHNIAFDRSAERRADEAVRQLHEKESLLREIHHRVKNNLQVVSSLLGLQSRALPDQAMRRMFQESQNRIHSMALLHESLYQSENLSRVDFPAYVRQLAAHLFHSYGVEQRQIRLRTELDNLQLSMDAAVPCGLIINELVSNALKYAFPEGRNGEVRIALSEQPGGRAVLVVADNGVGMQGDVDWTKAKSLGLRLVRTLAQQLEAQLEIESQAGTEVRLTFSAAA